MKQMHPLSAAILSVAALMLHRQSQVVVMETTWLTKRKILTIQSLQRKFEDSV